MNRSFLIIVLLITACSTRPHVVQHGSDFQGTGNHAVYVVHHGWHTGIVLSADAIQARLPALRERFDGAAYLEFGWGDRRFYQAGEMNSGLAMRAVFWPTDTVVRAVVVPDDLGRYFSAAGIVKLCASDGELASLADFVAGSFRTSDGELLPERGSDPGSQFYGGMGDYFLTNTCNSWTAKGLKSMGMDLSTTFKATAGSVMDYLHDHPGVQVIRRLDEPPGAPSPAAFTCPWQDAE